MNFGASNCGVHKAQRRGVELPPKQSHARVVSADFAACRTSRTNLTALILAALSCCYFGGSHPSTLLPVAQGATSSSSSTTSWHQSQQQQQQHLLEQSHAQASEQITIRTPEGQLFRGARQPGSEVAEFLGLRYASAPVKRLRFMPPTPFTYSKGPLHDLTRPGPVCMQRLPLEVTRAQRELIGQFARTATSNDSEAAASVDSRLELMRDALLGRHSRGASSDRLVRGKLGKLTQSEDCLNLNIYTPLEALARARSRVALADTRGDPWQASDSIQETDESKAAAAPNPATRGNLPVLVLVHGPSFDFGSGSLLEPREFAQNNRLIVITLNYRLNILGFPPKFGAASRGNLGLLDQVAALHWVRANINSFGGAPENVTLMGLQRGAVLVHLLMLSPLAKGLFQRAVLEDGTALSPVVANNLLGPSSAAWHEPHEHHQHQRQQVALLHLRALAQLCNCPLGATSSSNSNSSRLANGELSAGDHQTAASVFECLRAKPSEQLMQSVPSDLIDLARLGSPNCPPGHLPLASKWRAPLERLLELLTKEELKRRLEVAASAPGSGADEPPPLPQEAEDGRARQARQLDELKGVLEEQSGRRGGAQSPLPQLSLKPDQLQRLAALLVVKLEEHARGERRLRELITDLLGAIYLPSNETAPIGPVFAPHLETGTLMASPAGAGGDRASPEPESDQLANSMLARDSPFGQRDLMVGLSAPLVDFAGGRPTAKTEDQPTAQVRERESPLPLEPTQLAGRQLEMGLTEEQAIGQVNLFVRSFYRFHQQEISNSIVNQYLNNNKNLHLAQSVDSAATTTTSNNENSELAARATRRKQLFLRDSLQELHEDSLVRVPLLKTALIHSLRQLELLADMFVTQQLAKLQIVMDEAHAGGAHADSLWDGPAAQAAGRLLEPRQLEADFYTFARSFYRAAGIWPIELLRAAPGSNSTGQKDAATFEAQRPRSTYLYQFASSLDTLRASLSHRLQHVLTQLERQAVVASAELRPPVQELKSVLMRLVDELNDSSLWADRNDQGLELEFEFSLSCGFAPSSRDESNGLLRKLRDWICRERIGKRLVSFVRTGNANARETDNQQQQHRPGMTTRLESYQRDCGLSTGANELERGVERQQDHSVQLASAGSSRQSANYIEILVEQQQQQQLESSGESQSSCKKRIQALAFEFLMGFEFLQETAEPPPRTEWLVFNVFGQQLASFDMATHSATSTSDFSLESFVSSPAGQQRELLDSKVAFWANFIPALNCSRTQPIGAQSLSLFSQANSTLLNMNLNFNCQHQQQGGGVVATKTASALLQSMLARVRHELSEQVRARQRALLGARNQLAAAAAAASTENHHSPRMANMSSGQQLQQATEEPAAPVVVDSARQSPPTATSWLTASSTNSPASLSRRLLGFISRQSASVAFWLLSAGFLLVTLVVLASGLAVARQWRLARARWHKRKQRANKSSAASESPPAASLQLDAGFLREENHERPQTEQQRLNASMDADEEVNLRQQASSSTSFMTPPQQQRQGQEEISTEFLQDREDQLTIPPPPLPASLIANGHCATGDYSTLRGEHHLPGCNLLTMPGPHHEHSMSQQTGGLLTTSSSSETTNTQRAQSSVSLVSNSGTLVGGSAARGSAASVATIKKRVKISDPKRASGGARGLSATPISMYAENFCPIHRASSTNLNALMAHEQQLQQHQLTNNHQQHMPRSASTYYGQQQQFAEPHSLQYQGQDVCPAHGNYDQQQWQQQQQQQLMLMSQLYLTANGPPPASKTNSLRR